MEQYYIERIDMPKPKKRSTPFKMIKPIRKKLVIVGDSFSGKRTLLAYVLGVYC
jgi:hypothetical protein